MSRLLSSLTVCAILLFPAVMEAVRAQAQAPAGPDSVEKVVPAPKHALSKTAKAESTERALYLVSMNLIEREWNLNNTARVLELLQDTKDNKYRGFEWGFWNHRCHEERLTLTSQGGVNSVAFSPDGKSVLVGGNSKTATVRDAVTGKVTLTLRHEHGLTCAAYSPDGRRIVTCSNFKVIVWDGQTGKEIFTITTHEGAIRAVFSPDGTRLATAGLDGWAKIFDAQSGKEILTIKERAVGSLYAIAFSADGTRFASGNDNNTALVWDTKTGAKVQEFKGHTAQVNAVAFSPDGTCLSTGSWDNTAKVWDVHTGIEIYTLRGHTSGVSAVAFAPDGKHLVTGSEDSSARVWGVASGWEICAFKGHVSGVHSVAYSPDGARIVTGSEDTTAKVWIANPDITSSLLSKQASAIVLTDAAYKVSNNARKNWKLPFPLYGIGVPPRTLSPDGKLVVVQNGKLAQVWELETGKHLWTLANRAGNIFALAFSADSKRLASGSGDNMAKVWEATSGKELQTFRGHAGAVKAVAFSPDGRRLVTGSVDATARLWDVQTGKLLHILKGSVGEVYAVTIQCGGKRIATGGKDGAARIWDGETGRAICALVGQSDKVVYNLTLSPDGRRVVTGVVRPILWDGQTGREIGTLRGLRAYYFPVAFAPDSSRVLVGGTDNMAKLYDAETGQDILTFSIAGVTGWTNNVGFSPDGRRIVIQNGDAPPTVFLSRD